MNKSGHLTSFSYPQITQKVFHWIKTGSRNSVINKLWFFETFKEIVNVICPQMIFSQYQQHVIALVRWFKENLQ